MLLTHGLLTALLAVVSFGSGAHSSPSDRAVFTKLAQDHYTKAVEYKQTDNDATHRRLAGASMSMANACKGLDEDGACTKFFWEGSEMYRMQSKMLNGSHVFPVPYKLGDAVSYHQRAIKLHQHYCDSVFENLRLHGVSIVSSRAVEAYHCGRVPKHKEALKNNEIALETYYNDETMMRTVEPYWNPEETAVVPDLAPLVEALWPKEPEPTPTKGSEWYQRLPLADKVGTMAGRLQGDVERVLGQLGNLN